MAAHSKTSYDAVVIGAGVIGLSIAWRAAESGLSVAVVERDGAGAGASGVAAGMLAPVTEAEFGEQDLLRLNMAAADAWPAFDRALRERSGASTGYAESGSLVVAPYRDDAGELRRLHAFQRSLGLESEWLTRTDCRRLEPALAPGVAGGILAPHDHQVDPRAVVGALRIGLERAGGELLCGAEVQSLEVDRERVTGVRTPAGRLRGEHVVVAAGAFSGRLPGLPLAAVPPVRPVKGQILRLGSGGKPPLVTRVVRTPRCYILARPDGEVVIGATVEERGFDTRVTADGVYRLLQAAWEVLPDVAELELVETAARLRPGTPDNCPIIGAGALEGLVWATGHHRNGVLLAPLTADAIVRSLVDGDPSPAGARFSPERFDDRSRAGAHARLPLHDVEPVR